VITRFIDPDSVELAAAPGPLFARHDLLLVDLDGVVVLGDQVIPGSAAALTTARSAGTKVVFVTNNASRPPLVVAEQLAGFGVDARPDEVMTSAVAAATVIAGRVPSGAPVLVIGGAGLREALFAAGLRPVTEAAADPVAVVQGFAPEVDWSMLAEGTVAIRAGIPWISTNSDPTLPSPRGPLPGNGALVAAVAAATGATPEVIGKPGPVLYDAARRAHGGDRPLAVGDRLDTDIAGAIAAGLPSLLVLSGVSSPLDLLAAPASARPSYLGRDLGAITMAHPSARVSDGVGRCGGFEASFDGARAVVRVSGDGQPGQDDLDGLRALAVLAWCQSAGGAFARDSYEDALKGLNLNF